MSVPKDQRTQSKLEVCVQAHELAVYTLQICTNKKIFVEQYQDALTNKIIECALSVHTDLWAANNILVNSSEDYWERHSLQERAAIQCNVLLSLIQIAWKVFHLTSKRIMFWSGKAINTRNLILAWRDSDAKRYAQFRM